MRRRSSALVPLLVASFLAPSLADDRPADPGATWDRSRNKDGRWNQTEVGPFLASVLPTPSGTIAKGLSIKLGDDTTLAYDTATMTPRAAWTGGFLEFDPEKFGIVRAPKIDGDVQWVDAGPAWGKARVELIGHQLNVHGSQPDTPRTFGRPEGTGLRTSVTFRYHVDDAYVVETPFRLAKNGSAIFVRQFEIHSSNGPVTLHIASRAPSQEARAPHVGVVLDGRKVALDEGRIEIPASKTASRLLVGTSKTDADPAASLVDLQLEWLGWRPKQGTFRTVAAASPRLWEESPTTAGEVARDDAPYVVDTITVPFDNPWKSLMFLTGLDFLPDGTLAVCTLYGDVWLVEGVDDDLEEVTWRRFATGLHQPLGLKVVGGKVCVLGRDQITRLHDRDDNGEADFYENVNNDGQTSTSGHDYAACLETDPDGNFYYIRAHEGVVRVSADGKTSQSIAKGFRNPVGLGVSPDGMVTAAPQEGTWTPASSIIEVKEGGWYGFAGPKEAPERPLGYDPPICWMPRLQDNSSGGQVWAPKTGFGPLSGKMLHLSYGQCALLEVMHEKVDGVSQGATFRLPMFFESGVMRGRFGPDGHLYVCGLRGWQTSAAKDGCLQRVRFTGRKAALPVEFHVRQEGIELVFSEPLDRETAADPQNWAVEQWNYKYSKAYGSEDYRVSDPRKTGRDEVFLADVALSEDGRRVLLEFEDGAEPVMQVGVTYNVKAADGTALRETLYGTINRVPAK